MDDDLRGDDMDRLLIDYLPNFMQEYKQIKEIMKVQQPQINAAWDNANKVLQEQYINTATDEGLKRLERIYNITIKETDSIETRRAMLLLKLGTVDNPTLRVISNKLNEILQGKEFYLIVNYSSYAVSILIPTATQAILDATVSYLRKIIPANLTITADILTQYIALGAYTHESLSGYTYEEISKGEMNT